MAKKISESIEEFRQHYPGVALLVTVQSNLPRAVAVVTAQAKGRENAMAVSLHMPVSYAPPIYAVAISPNRFTYKLIVDSKEFGVNFLPFEAAELVASVGGSLGTKIDKFQKFNIAKDKPVRTAVPILKAAYAAYECRLVNDSGYGDHRLLVGEIEAVHLQEGAFTPDGVLDLDKVNPGLYLGNDLYLTALKDSVRNLDRKVYGKR